VVYPWLDGPTNGTWTKLQRQPYQTLQMHPCSLGPCAISSISIPRCCHLVRGMTGVGVWRPERGTNSVERSSMSTGATGCRCTSKVAPPTWDPLLYGRIRVDLSSKNSGGRLSPAVIRRRGCALLFLASGAALSGRPNLNVAAISCSSLSSVSNASTLDQKPRAQPCHRQEHGCTVSDGVMVVAGTLYMAMTAHVSRSTSMPDPSILGFNRHMQFVSGPAWRRQTGANLLYLTLARWRRWRCARLALELRLSFPYLMTVLVVFPPLPPTS